MFIWSSNKICLTCTRRPSAARAWTSPGRTWRRAWRSPHTPAAGRRSPYRRLTWKIPLGRTAARCTSARYASSRPPAPPKPPRARQVPRLPRTLRLLRTLHILPGLISRLWPTFPALLLKILQTLQIPRILPRFLTPLTAQKLLFHLPMPSFRLSPSRKAQTTPPSSGERKLA